MDNDLIAAFELVEQFPDNWLVCIIRHLFGGSIEYNVSIDLVDDDGHGIRMLGKASERSLPSAIRKAILDATERELALALHETLDQLAAVIAQRDDWKRKAEQAERTYDLLAVAYAYADHLPSCQVVHDSDDTCDCGYREVARAIEANDADDPQEETP